MRIIPFIAAAATLTAAATANPDIAHLYIRFEPAGDHGQAENRFVSGLAALRYRESTGFTRVALLVSGLQPNTTYGFMVGDAYVDPDAIQTTWYGAGHIIAEFPFPPFPENPAIQIFIYDGNEEEVDIVTLEELRAVGGPL